MPVSVVPPSAVALFLLGACIPVAYMSARLRGIVNRYWPGPFPSLPFAMLSYDAVNVRQQIVHAVRANRQSPIAPM
ncbi:hypothetical protein L226DRAFT_112840 [Lentinus tigrinus ALCF2SS1-7]|uniref:Uncharacterized protein n=1 Tax=Lentinus tigrinus ALCF2SS1-6 TaxID=1328759 RepID=A0A5C2S1F6_9APHY|nr:hypothetical protein L227DRAFT_233517 [Lentinus tigrinus ALCF2SS1-6]RPD73135.1 hypothetical protein L226DRAFT_112840 [Lentinus tigrinus ALCF2SS1-7]